MDTMCKKRKYAALLCVISSCVLLEQSSEQKRKKRTIWVRKWLQKRPTAGANQTVLREFREIDNQRFLFHNFLRMDERNFNKLLQLISPQIQKQDTNMRKAIPPCERLAVTLRYLATGDSFKSLSVLFRIAPNTISKVVPDVCDAIYLTLKNEYMQVPSTSEEWTNIASKFEEDWNFPNCIGALDGKHIVMKAPAHSGSTFYNYKSTHSIVLMAIVNAQYKVIYIDIGCYGRVSDGGVFNKCSFSAALKNNRLNIPLPRPLPDCEMDVPFTLVADDAFAMQTNLMKPYQGRNLTAGQRIFNYRLSRARRAVENAFGILVARFQVFSRPIKLDANKTKRLTLACCALHNFLLHQSAEYVAPSMVDRYDKDGNQIPAECSSVLSMQIEQEMEEMSTSNIVPTRAKAIREEYEKYFMTRVGELSWQYKFI